MTASTRAKVVLVDLDGQPIADWVSGTLASEGIDLKIAQCSTRADLEQNAAEAEIVWLFGGSRILRDGNLAAAPRCWAIVRTGSGTDNVPVDEATSRGIVVANTPAAFSEAVADHVIGLMFATSRRIVELDRKVRLGRWNQNGSVPLSLVQGQTLGLVGFGHIARSLMRKLSGFELNVLVYDPFISEDVIREHGARGASFESLLSESDYISLHCPLTESTRHLMGQQQFHQMKPTAIFINTSRGPVVDQQALLRALQERRIAAAGLDVFEEEPLSKDDPLTQLDNVVLTPHSAGYAANGIELRWQLSVETVIALARRRWPQSCVNPHVKPREALTR